MNRPTVREILIHRDRSLQELQRLVNSFVDEFRRAAPGERKEMIKEGPSTGVWRAGSRPW